MGEDENIGVEENVETGGNNMTILAIVEKGADGLYSVWSDQCFGHHFFGGYGESVEEAKKDFLDSVNEALTECRQEDDRFCGPEYDEIHISYRFDIPSFFFNISPLVPLLSCKTLFFYS